MKEQPVEDCSLRIMLAIDSSHGRKNVSINRPSFRESMNTFTYHIGHLGVDDGEQILILTQAACDWGPFQMDNPKEINNITVHTTDLRDWWHGSNRSMPTRDPGGGAL